MDIIYKPIGIIHTPFISREGMPIQSNNSREVKGYIELNDTTSGNRFRDE